MPTEVVLYGAGGHAKVVYDAIAASNHIVVSAIVDEDSGLQGLQFSDFVILPPSFLHGTKGAAVHLSIGDNAIRQRIISELTARDFSLLSIVHPCAIVSKESSVESGCFLAAGAIVGPDSWVGAGSIVNHAAVVDHDCSVGPYSHLCPNATLGGGVVLGEGVLVGAGAVVLPGIRIGENAIIGAGAVVISDVNPRQTVLGIPAAQIPR